MKIIVGGCSISDYTPGVKKVYGEILAEKIDADYIHHGAGCGSNYRIWRNITRMVMNNEIDENDIVLIQYTDANRDEYWSATSTKIGNYKGDKIIIREQKYDGDIIRFKASLSMPNKNEQKFFDLKQAYFTSNDFNDERFEYNHFLFHNLMISKNIKVAYVVLGGMMAAYNLEKIHLFNKNGEIHITDGMYFKSPNEYFSIDGTHWNQTGHKYVANVLQKFIKNKKWV